MLDTTDNRLAGSALYMSDAPVDETVVWFNAMHQPHAASQEELMRQLEEGGVLPVHIEGLGSPAKVTERDVSTLVDAWAGGCPEEAIRRMLTDLPADYDADAVASTATLERLEALTSDMKEAKDAVDSVFRKELHDYRGRSLEAVPILLDVCDVLDSSRDECVEKSLSIGRSAARVRSSLRMVALYRSRSNWRWLRSTLDGVITWQEKFDQLLGRIGAKEYAVAASILGAKLKPVGGRYFIKQAVDGSPGSSSWVVADNSSDADGMDFEDFVQGVSGCDDECLSQLVAGRFALAQYFELRRRAGPIIGGCIRDDLATVLGGDLSKRTLVLCLRGLHALHVRHASIGDVFMEIVGAVFTGGVDDAVAKAIDDEDSKVSRDVQSLMPPEFSNVVLSVLRHLAQMLRHMLKVAAACTGIAREMATSKDTTSSVEETATVVEGLNGLAKQKRNIGGRALTCAVEFCSRMPLSKGNISDALHVYRLLYLFIDVCRCATPDDVVASTTGSVRFQWTTLFTDHFVQQDLEELLKLMQTEQFAPFPVNADDLSEVAPLVERDEDTVAVTASFDGFLQLSAPNALSKDVEEQLRLDEAPNPFESNLYFLQPSFRPIEWAPGRSASLFDEGYPTFTLSSFTVCKKMLDMVGGVRSLGSSAPDVCVHIHQLASVYALFIGTHFLTSSEEVPLDLDEGLPAEVRAHAAVIRKCAQSAASQSSHLLSAGFPYLEAAACHSWKRAKDQEALLFAAWQRCTAIASLECVAKCHRMCAQALTGLLFESPSALHSVADMVESITGFTKFGIRHGMRQLANQLIPSATIAAEVEKCKWDTSNATELVESPFVQRSVQGFVRFSNQLRDQFQGSSMAAVGMLQNHYLFNVFVGFVEGITRVKKFSDAGRSRAVTDALFLTKTMKDHHPTLSPHLAAYVIRVAHTIGSGQWQDAIDLVEQHHSLYTTRQLLSFGEREGFLKKRDMDKLLRSLNHEDRLPLHLVEDCIL